MTSAVEDDAWVWYAAYGTNLRRERFLCYLDGGRPEGALRAYPGCRDGSAPRAEVVLSLPGRLTFGGESSTWTGGMAFLETSASTRVWARGYLVTVGQFSDVVAQEIRAAPGRDLTIDVVAAGGAHGLGRGRYDHVLNLGQRDGHPVVAITASRTPEPAAPAQSYLWSMAVGLREAHGLSAPEVATYLAAAPGVSLRWTSTELLEIAATSSRARPARTAAATRAGR